MSQQSPQAAGRPRNTAKDAAILDATLTLLATEGFTGMSLRQVAESAGVSKATVHLRWKTKDELVTAALESVRLRWAAPQSNDTRTDLIAVLDDFTAVMEHARGMQMIGTCLSEQRNNPNLLALLRERTVHPRRLLLHQILLKARDRGEIRPDADLDTAVSALLGSYFADYLAEREGDPDWSSRAVHLVMNGLATKA